MIRKNKNRGYQKLRVWGDAIDYFVATCRSFKNFPHKRLTTQAISSTDSVHRNIAEGYCRRSVHEYLNFLNIALGSLGESVSSLQAYRKAGLLNEQDFQQLDTMAYKIENELLKLVEALEKKREKGEWIDRLVTRESNTVCDKP